MIKPIYLYGAEVLRKTAAPADLSDKAGIQALVQDLKDTLVVADGCGLAAPQIGVSLRVVIVDGDVVSDTYDYLKGFRRTLINPEILEESEEKLPEHSRRILRRSPSQKDDRTVLQRGFTAGDGGVRQLCRPHDPA